MIEDAKKVKPEDFMEELYRTIGRLEINRDMYAKAEEAWEQALKEMITSQTFLQILNPIRDYQRASEIINQQSVDKYLGKYPLPSEKDITRVAELIISLESKVDDFGDYYSDHINSMAASLIKTAERQSKIMEETRELMNDVAELKHHVIEMKAIMKSLAAGFSRQGEKT